MTQSNPSPATRAALIALLRADKGISPPHRHRVIAAFDAGTGARPLGWVSATQAALKIGVAASSVLRWAEEGKIQSRHAGERFVLVDADEVAAYAAAHPQKTGPKPRA